MSHTPSPHTIRSIAFAIFVVVCALVKVQHSATAHFHLAPGHNTLPLPLLVVEGDLVELKIKQIDRSDIPHYHDTLPDPEELGKLKLHFQGTVYGGIEVAVPSKTAVSSESTIDVESETSVNVELEYRLTSRSVAQLGMIMQLGFSVVLLFLWRRAKPHAVAGVALTSALATISLVLTSAESIIAIFFYTVNVGSTLLTWRRLITGERPRRGTVAAISGLTLTLLAGRVGPNFLGARVLVVAVLLGLTGNFVNLWRRANENSMHAFTAIAWCFGSLAEIFLCESLAALVWAEALAVLYVAAVRESKVVDYVGAELADLESPESRVGGGGSEVGVSHNLE